MQVEFPGNVDIRSLGSSLEEDALVHSQFPKFNE